MKDVSKYTIEIADGYYYTEAAFKINIIKTFLADTNKLIGEVPYFDRKYTWRVTYNKTNSETIKSELHHFSTLISETTDPCAYRLRILTPATTYKDALIFLDSHSALYDMNGQPVWFLPVKDKKRSIPRDLKITPYGTITYMMAGNIYEINYEGEVLWKGPENGNLNDKTMMYHHEFTRLKNGNYMVLGNESMWAKKTATNDSVMFIPEHMIHPDTSDHSIQRIIFGTIIEYDKNGNEIWSWKSSNFYASPDIVHRDPRANIMNTHENAFFFDEQNKAIYLSFKGTSSILKIKYPDGTVLNSYGLISKRGMTRNETTFFCEQHSCMISDKGYLYLFNNNTCNPTQLCKILMLQEPSTVYDTLKAVWEYECTIERTAQNAHTRYSFTSGGNVIELPDRSIFAYMGANYGKVFIVGQDKKIRWSALPEKWHPIEQRWDVISNYRASIITERTAVERLIWSAQK